MVKPTILHFQYLFGSLVLYSCISSYVLSTAFFVSPPAPIQRRCDHLLLLLTTLHYGSLARPCLPHFQSQNQNRVTPVPASSDAAAASHCYCIPLSYALALFFDSVFDNMLSSIWCDVDVVEFSYYGAPAPTPKEQLYTELADGLRGSDSCIGFGSQRPTEPWRLLKGKRNNNKVDVDFGCGLVGRILQLKSNNRLRKSSVHSLPLKASNNKGQQRDHKVENESNKPQIHESKTPSPRNKFTETFHTLNDDNKQARKSTSAYRNSQN
ncbi:hypothetical protein Ahy_B03g063425 isoform F [Arachis hypogaea]|uniref:Uncharacterized protein n=1 Tax=Arachis hypogaea TaxID=3818 RepID=A0A444ZXQ5_ARAHY|nr:hypothetical protein Ahy_B03g063425 isoform F [Arachis hypogaea]